MTSYSSFKQKLGVLKTTLETEGSFSLGKAVEINRNKMSIPITIDTGASFQIQLPECGTKQGVVSTGSRTYIDLVFDNSSDQAFLLEFEDFVSLLQSKCAREIYQNRSDWLATDIDDADENHSIETFEEMFYPVTRAINRGANVVLRVDIGRGSRGTNASLPPETSCEVYNKSGEERPFTSIHKNSRLIPLIEFSEILISSTSINLVTELKECLLLDEVTPVPKRERSIMLEGTLEKESREQSTTQDKEEIVGVDGEPTEDEPDACQFEASNEGEDEKASDSDLVEVDIQVQEDDEPIQAADNEEGLTEIDNLEVTADESITLKEPNEVYREIYKAAIAKAKRLRQVALDAYLDAKKIKARFMLDDIEDSDDDEDMEDSEDYIQPALPGN